MKKLIKKLFLVFLVIFLWMFLSFLIDPFGVFHPEHVRGYKELSINSNFVKTYHVIKNPKRYNAFILGSSRVGGLPLNNLPKMHNGKKLNWYPLNYPSGTPEEFLKTLQILLKYDINIDYLLVCFENNAKFHKTSENEKDLQTFHFQNWDRSKLNFYKYYFFIKPDKDLFYSIFHYDSAYAENFRKSLFVFDESQDLSVPESQNWTDDYEIRGFSTGEYTEKNAPIALGTISKICEKKHIPCIFILNPTFQNVYKKETSSGLYDFIYDVAKNCNFYNFAGLNNYTNDTRYFSDRSHYRSYVGNEMEKIIFGNDEQKIEAIKEAGEGLPYDTAFGMYVTNENVRTLIDILKGQF